MKQLSFLHHDSRSEQNTPEIKKAVSFWKLFIDGASRNNPGPSGAGIVLFKDGKPCIKKGYYLNTKTNNQAEYLALLIGMYYVQQSGVAAQEPLAIYSDSQLMISQLSGVYQVKNSALKKYYDAALALLRTYNYTLHHVLRHNNTDADELANSGIDKRVVVPEACIAMMQSYDIEW